MLARETVSFFSIEAAVIVRIDDAMYI